MIIDRQPVTPQYLQYRYVFDGLLAVLMLIATLPIMLIAALLVSLDGGPIIFRQIRLGKFGEEFEILKFRSMVVNADDYLDQRGQVVGDRVTSIGKLLRKTSIDELPQLINIFRGDMAIIGPRPILPSMYPYLTDFEKRRFEARPGITGLAQVTGRNNVKWSQRFVMDVEYIVTANLFNDILIALKTVKMVLTSADTTLDRNSDQVDDITNRTIG
jgi:undecaprenyl phosphate N,N'-diacetylbacillosamine 1-phosphate transferase